MKTWQTVDRSKWKWSGVPDDEPDKAQWIDQATGLDCLINRGPSGALCGYVGVPEGHRLYGVDYDNVRVNNPENDGYPDVHWGLTYADRCQPSEDPSRGICHTGEVANKNVWWLGFDCAHSGDICPSYMGDDDFWVDRSSYKDFNFVRTEVEVLAKQIAA